MKKIYSESTPWLNSREPRVRRLTQIAGNKTMRSNCREASQRPAAVLADTLLQGPPAPLHTAISLAGTISTLFDGPVRAFGYTTP